MMAIRAALGENAGSRAAAAWHWRQVGCGKPGRNAWTPHIATAACPWCVKRISVIQTLLLVLTRTLVLTLNFCAKVIQWARCRCQKPCWRCLWSLPTAAMRPGMGTLLRRAAGTGGHKGSPSWEPRGPREEGGGGVCSATRRRASQAGRQVKLVNIAPVGQSGDLRSVLVGPVGR